MTTVIPQVLLHILENKAGHLCEQWLHQTVATYPADASRFFLDQKDQFLNPVGHTLSVELANLYGEVIGAMDRARIQAALTNIIKIRAVQDYSPSEALAPLNLLKGIILDAVRAELVDSTAMEGFLLVERRIDELVMVAFDIYVGCREKIAELKSLEAKNSVYVLLERMNRQAGKMQNGEGEKE
jgi:hypothetical protein